MYLQAGLGVGSIHYGVKYQSGFFSAQTEFTETKQWLHAEPFNIIPKLRIPLPNTVYLTLALGIVQHRLW